MHGAAPLNRSRCHINKQVTGKIFIAATPIGNLKDITLRAINVLKEVDFIVCEDTRNTSVLLKHYEIKKELIAVNAVNEDRKKGEIINRILSGKNCAIVTDAGTPCISDPGAKLISGAISNEIDIIPLPGPSAVTTALSISGLPSSSFFFEGFLPQKKGRQKKLKEFSEIKNTIVLYESTYRIEKLLQELNEYMSSRYIVVCRELTKKFEEVWRGTASEILSRSDRTLKGEFVVIISPKDWKHKE